jgi:ankyrin repeat protein/Cdc6-like AAA superfamily ATPase
VNTRTNQVTWDRPSFSSAAPAPGAAQTSEPVASKKAGAKSSEPAAKQLQTKRADPAVFLLPEGCDEHLFNNALKPPQASSGIDDITSSVLFWRVLTKVVPISKIAELVSNKDKAQRTAIQHLKDMNLSKSYRKLTSFAGKEAGIDLLHECLEKSDRERFCLLLEVDSDLIFARTTVIGESGCTIFHAAAKITGALECLEELVSKLDPQDRDAVLNASSYLPAKNTALHHAARSGNAALILKLHEWGAIANKTNGDDHTPLDVAAKFNQYEAFCALLSLNRSQKVSVSQVLSNVLKGMDKKFPDAIVQHNSDCDRIGLEQRKADFEKWRARVLQELRAQHSALFEVIELSQRDPTFGSALIAVCAPDEKESISRIKRGSFEGDQAEYDVLCPSVFDRSDVVRLHSNLYQCIAFTLSNIASFVDVQEKLLAYESSCPNAQKSALYFVAWARAAAFRGDANDALLQQHALATFVAYCKAQHIDASEWLSPAEASIAAQDPMTIFNTNSEKSANEHELDAPQDDAWLEKLSDSKREPFDKLSKLVGLESIKQNAKWMYEMAVSQKENKRLGIKSSTIERLNFAFLGNPGTGKTTVASIVAKILYESGARGPGYIKMTGPEALSMGSKEFCARLAKLTGDVGSQAPPSTFRKGIQVEMCWDHERECADIDTFRKFTPATESATILSIENGRDFVCDRSIPLAEGDSVKFMGAIPGFLERDTSYTVDAIARTGQCFSLQNAPGVKNLSQPEPFQVQWLKCIRGIKVQANYVFHCDVRHHLEPDYPIRFTTDVGTKIAKGARVYVKRVIDAFSFTVSLALTKRDKADAELCSSVTPAEVGTVYVDNKTDHPVCSGRSARAHIGISRHLQWFPAKLKDTGTEPQHWLVLDTKPSEHPDIHEKHLRFVETKVEATGGVLFIDEAHELQPLREGGREGKAILNAIMQAAEEHRDKVGIQRKRWPAKQTLFSSQVSIILGGYKDKIENELYAADKGLRSRFIPFEFADYSDAELFRILKTKCEEDRCARALFASLTFAMNVRCGSDDAADWR